MKLNTLSYLTSYRRNLETKIPISEEDVEDYFNELQLPDIRLLDLCVKREIPIIESRIGKIIKTSPLIVGCSKLHCGVSPFAISVIRELIPSKKIGLTRAWKEILDSFLNTLLKETYPLVELKPIFEFDGAYCWELRYTDNPSEEPIRVGILLVPYIFRTSSYSTILDEMKTTISIDFNIILLIKETLPTVAEAFKYESRNTLLFLLIDEKEKKFYAMELGESTNSESKQRLIDSFLSQFLEILEKNIQITQTWPLELKDHLEILKYYKKFPRLVEIERKIKRAELHLRDCLRERFRKVYGEDWKEVVRDKLPGLVKKFKGVIRGRPDKHDVKDFLDGATLGELIEIFKKFSGEFGLEKDDLTHLETLSKYRKIMIHPIKEQENDLDEKTFNKLRLAIEYVDRVLCSSQLAFSSFTNELRVG